MRVSLRPAAILLGIIVGFGTCVFGSAGAWAANASPWIEPARIIKVFEGRGAAYWNEGAVRLVLRFFPPAVQPDDQQIAVWADMSPADAINQIIAFDGNVGNTPTPVEPAPSEPPPVTPKDPGPARFEMVSEQDWNELAVRKVLHTFAYGGQADGQQIRRWADMSPEAAIVEMLNFDQHNQRLSPPADGDMDRLDERSGTLRDLGDFWSSDDPENGVGEGKRALYVVDNRLDHVWVKAATSRGLNPFRHKIGLWETNYHMATDRGSVTGRHMVRYYDDIMGALEQGLPYQDVMTVAASSAAVATQYGHRFNVYRNDECKCNEDFAREYNQLFFGILGEDDPNYHETVTIKNMAAALTDMRLRWDKENGLPDEVEFGTEWHYPGALEILGLTIWGNDASERLDALGREAIEHPESLDNLPVKIVEGLADDNLDADKIDRIRGEWASMEEKNLLTFLRAYAISYAFHDESRVKYLNSIDRHLLIANRMTLNNEEGYLDLYGPHEFQKEGVVPFRPIHQVFGGQTGIEAADSPDVFRANYNRAVRDAWRFRRPTIDRYGRHWEKDWASVAPRDASGQFIVHEIAEWLWNRFVGDGLKNFGTLERAHLYAILATDRDLTYLVDPEHLDRVITPGELKSDPDLVSLIDELAHSQVRLDAEDTRDRQNANRRIGQAVNFIIGTPYILVQEGR